MLHSSLAHTTRSLRQQQLQFRRLRWSVIGEGVVTAAALPVLVLPGMPTGRWVAVLGVVVCMVSAVVKWHLIDPEHGTNSTSVGVSSLAMAAGALLLEAYFGVGSAVAALITVGVLAHAMDDPSRWPARVAGFVFVGHLTLATLCEVTSLPIHRVDWFGHSSTIPVRIALHLGIASLYVMAHVYGRRLRRESAAAQDGLDEADHAVALSEALLAEARAELLAARSVGRGRFTGVRLGRFVLGTLLGRGGMGEVYEARDEHGTRAALKVLRFGRGSLDARTLARFEQESRILSTIESPFLVKVLEVSHDEDEFPFIAMELLSGLDLERYLVRHGELLPDEVLQMVGDVARALDAAHRRGVVHRDLKPANVFRTLVDGEPSWRVLDFGIALLRTTDRRITTEQQVGTVGYMAPEQRLEGADVDQRADVYALAVVTLECLTLFNPVVTNLDRTLGSWSPDAIARLDEALSELPGNVASVLRRALAEDPAARFRDCIGFHEALSLAYADPSEASGPTWLQRADAEEFGRCPRWQGHFGASPPRRPSRTLLAGRRLRHLDCVHSQSGVCCGHARPPGASRAMKKTIPTFCRVCEPSCGLLADVEDDRLVRLRPDREHPVTQGFACHKGIGFTDVHHDPDRLSVPLHRTRSRASAGELRARSWDEVLPEIAAALRGIQQQHGPNSVAGYIGNPTAFNALGSQALTSFFAQLGTSRMFSSGTQDCSNKFAGSEAVFGTSTLHPVPDLEHTHYALIFGENPKVSHMSFMSTPDPMGKLREAQQRGATIRFVNPRRIESATVGDVVQIQPDTDLYFMAALLHELDAAGEFDDAVLAEHGKHLAGLREFIAPYSADAVASVVGVPAATIRTVAHELASAPSACVHMSTGVNMGRQGTLCYWLLHMLSFVTGNLDRPGGNLYSLGFYPAAKAGKLDLTNVFFPTEHGELRHVRGMLPGNLLADMIESDEAPIRALVVIAGNPILSMGGGERLRRAFEKLELIVVLDMFRSATGEYADYLLPCTDMLERRDLTICGLGMQHQPFVQYTDAVVPPAFERKEEWWILGKLEQALGLRSVFDAGDEPDVFARLDKMLRASDLSVQQLRAAPHHTVTLPELSTGRFYSEWIQTPDKRVDCCPPLFGDALARAHVIFDELRNSPPEQLKLISLRTIAMQNSWYQNVDKLKGRKHQHNPLHVSVEDAARLGLQDGAAVAVTSDWGRIEASVRVDETLRAGVVAMTHGWGNERTPGLRVASRYPGVNVNELLPTGPGSYEKLSNQAHMTGVPVVVTLA